MSVSVKQLMAAANEAVPKISADEARKLMAKDALLVDVRDGTEVAKSGKLRGAVHVSRGMIEFRADPESPYHDPQFRKDRPVILYCASGGRSALAGKVLKDMGYTNVHNLGGFKDAADTGLEVEPA
ncbi:MAG TPA: rhodanese-like domain-containing protein [Nordella sp.]|nr:rhodanese-like domain-containing protein [Nordella sp.]